MKPFFGLSNQLSSIFISFIIFGYSIYIIISERIVSIEQIRIAKLKDWISHTGEATKVEYDFETTTTSWFGLYQMEISIIKVCVSFLLFIVLLVGASQKSKILLRIWMMIHALVIIIGFVSMVVVLTDNHFNSAPEGESSNNLAKFLITLAFSLWFFTIVLSLHEQIELAEEMSRFADESSRQKRNCVFVAKNGIIAEEKCPPFYEC